LRNIFFLSPNKIKGFFLENAVPFLFHAWFYFLFFTNRNRISQGGHCYIKRQRLCCAIKDYDQAIALDSGVSANYFNRAIARSRMKDFTGGIADYTKSIQLKEDPESFYNRAQMYLEMKNYKPALADLEKSFEAKKEKPVFYFLRVNCKFMLQDYESAITDMTEAITLKPDFAQAYLTRGLVFSTLKDKNKACADFSKAKESGSAKAGELMQKYCE
jgi:tetratricopeptide (TPR) repeat protein